MREGPIEKDVRIKAELPYPPSGGPMPIGATRTSEADVSAAQKEWQLRAAETRLLYENAPTGTVVTVVMRSTRTEARNMRREYLSPRKYLIGRRDLPSHSG